MLWSEWVLPVAFVVAVGFDVLVGELPSRIHPVVWMGTVIGWLRGLALRGSRWSQRLTGGVLTVGTMAAFAALSWASLRLTRGSWLGQLAMASFWITASFAWTELAAAARRMQVALEAGDLEGARRDLSSLCSRDPDQLDEEALTAATLESISENASDSVVAPLFYLALFGVPGMVAYRAANTLDAMIGYRGRWEHGGKAAARIDDLLNLVPARLTAVLLLVSGMVHGLSVRRGWRVMVRDARLTESPNAGWPMAAFAGLLGVRLEKAQHYALGDAEQALAPAAIRRGLVVVHTACLLAVVLAGAALVVQSW